MSLLLALVGESATQQVIGGFRRIFRIRRVADAKPKIVVTKQVKRAKPAPSVRLPVTLHDDRLEKLAKALDDALRGYLEWVEEDDAESLMLLL